METLKVALVLAMVPFATANPIMYAYVYNWRRSAEGRAVMNLLVSWAALIDLAVLFWAVPSFPGKSWVAIVVYLGILTGTVRLSVVIARALRNQRRRRADKP